MIEVTLKPIKEDPAMYDKLEALILEIFREEIYLPLVEELPKKKVLRNSPADLVFAIQTGRLVFDKGVFRGKLNSTLTTELKALGAKWDRKLGAFRMPMKTAPPEIRSAIQAQESRFAATIKKIDDRLGAIVPEQIVDKFKMQRFFDKTLFKLDKEISQTMKNITVSPKLTPEQRTKIADEYTLNLEKYIQEFSVEHIVELREKIQKNVMGGKRWEEMYKTIQQSYGVTERKAKFLARQETGLMMAKFKEVRYTDAGVNEYYWTCVAGSPLHPVRPSHKALNGKKFKFDDPPVTSMPGEPLRRNNPGEDYNCRCFARPIVKFKK